MVITEEHLSFGVEYISKDIEKCVASTNIITNIYRKQAYNSIMCEYFSIGFFDFMILNLF